MNSPQNPDQTHGHGHIRSYVLRQGRVSSAQQRHYEEGLPRWGIPYRNELLDLAAVFGRTASAAPKILEIGCGMGETTAAIAAAHPENDYLGIEVHTPGVGSLLKEISERDLRNLRICQHDAVEVLRDMIPPASLAGVHVYFPDPWPKKRQQKRRLIQAPLVHLIAERLMPGGYLHCATDWEEYALQMVDVLAAEPLLENTGRLPGGFAARPDYRPQTKFETRGLRLGHGVWDVIFRRREEAA
ncbi:tRNA (guanine-N(7)-)-methyltransferase [Sterolibacterium denitrificans]|uniref:tRNA (guanine-N(7)-)-methyltransferase n=1 Tax=Sterolibacterium denitrificans TaxID=157592 RepID=A0A7Z7HQK9_9PROT|nr:tRNA (guanosine(46)-N7)-methyltransferase TrmB [Sterolibacterium denitrificans]SMB21272.1 tRNA (guanine-N(7)-)-methyltransferase [Sterolibacterium denitrificans]